jgi:hypothetical protein
MIRTGYLRWEIDVGDQRCEVDPRAREVTILARPTYRIVRIKNAAHQDATQRFVRGEVGYANVVETRERSGCDVDLRVPDVGPRLFRYTEADRLETPRFWLTKLQREVQAFAHELVRQAGRFPELVISEPALRVGYARLVETEIFRVIDGRSTPEPTRESEPMELDLAAYQTGVPELVAAELVRDVVDKKEFSEFCSFDRVTVRSGDKYYRIPRRPHALIEVWNAHTMRGEARLCVVFQDPGMPPSDELVMKYLLAKHQPDLLWKTCVRFSAPTGTFDGAAPRRWKDRSL